MVLLQAIVVKHQSPRRCWCARQSRMTWEFEHIAGFFQIERRRLWPSISWWTVRIDSPPPPICSFLVSPAFHLVDVFPQIFHRFRDYAALRRFRLTWGQQVLLVLSFDGKKGLTIQNQMEKIYEGFFWSSKSILMQKKQRVQSRQQISKLHNFQSIQNPPQQGATLVSMKSAFGNDAYLLPSKISILPSKECFFSHLLCGNLWNQWGDQNGECVVSKVNLNIDDHRNSYWNMA